jgi:mandelate racemase
MNVPHLTIAGVTAKAVVAPLARPVRTAVGTIPAAPLVLIDVTTREGITGQAYIFAYTTTALPALHRIVGDIGAELIGMPAAPQEWRRARLALFGTDAITRRLALIDTAQQKSRSH